MELYHLHLKGIRDDKWKEKKEIIIDKNFTNRLGNKVNNFNDCTVNNELRHIINEINTCFRDYGYQTFSKMPLYLVFDHLIYIMEKENKKITPELQLTIFKELRNMTFQAAIAKRELAMENFRKDNKQELPSRLHCLYATTENGIKYWKNNIVDGELEVFRIDTLSEPFITSETFIPDEDSTYEQMYNGAFRYWNPKLKNMPEDTFEYLVQGKVKILEKVDEIRRN